MTAQVKNKACGEAKTCVEDHLVIQCTKDVAKAAEYDKCKALLKASQGYAHQLEGVIQEKQKEAQRKDDKLVKARFKTAEAEALAQTRKDRLDNIFRSPWFWFGAGVFSTVLGYGVVKVVFD